MKAEAAEAVEVKVVVQVVMMAKAMERAVEARVQAEVEMAEAVVVRARVVVGRAEAM